ncbi:GNAT family N-acetyltransferase [Kribbella sp. NBC_00709]|uniref:GNAT family N-acetyltransferase n=1 Tax=Kribbella sp. NBC_00709 TaxID=2975972 RepID=UPI002E29F0E3|nr:GNAT family N-acetyltransferase [Kribbella sp. NBC_00709]
MEFSTRPAILADAPAIHQLIAAAEQALHGQVEAVPDAVAADLRRPLIQLDLDTRVAEAPNGDLAGWAWVHGGRHAKIDVHPSYAGRGLGTQLLDWAEARAYEIGTDWLAQIVDDADQAGTELVRSRGYEVLATNWLLERPLSPEPPAVPTGIRLDGYDPARAHDVHQLIEQAFSAFQPRAKSFDEWAELTVGRSTFLPDVSTLAYAGDELVGAVIALDGEEGYVEQLAVRDDQRNKGIARAMLDRTCTEFLTRGRRTCILWTHSGTGALAMYERLGMRVRRSTTVYRTQL